MLCYAAKEKKAAAGGSGGGKKAAAKPDAAARAQRKRDVAKDWEEAKVAAGAKKGLLWLKGQTYSLNSRQRLKVRPLPRHLPLCACVLRTASPLVQVRRRTVEPKIDFSLGARLLFPMETSSEEAGGSFQVKLLREVAPPKDTLKSDADEARRARLPHMAGAAGAPSSYGRLEHLPRVAGAARRQRHRGLRRERGGLDGGRAGAHTPPARAASPSALRPVQPPTPPPPSAPPPPPRT